MAKQTKKSKSSLLQAIEFISFAQHTKGDDPAHFCILENHTAVAFDGILAIGCPIQEDLEACPNSALLEAALSKAGAEYALTQLAEDRVSVRSGEFQAVIPCLPRTRLTAASPDAASTQITGDLIASLKLALPLVDPKADKVILASIQLNNGSLCACDGKIILECWHGNYFERTSLLPKQAANALIKCGKRPVSVGYGESTLTFYFEDESWIRTQLYKDEWPDVTGRLNVLSEPRAFVGFFEAASIVAPFTQDGLLYCDDGYIYSHNPFHNSNMTSRHAAVTICGPRGKMYDADSLRIISKFAKTFDENASQEGTLFFGDSLRGAVFHRILKAPESKTQTQPYIEHCDGCNVDWIDGKCPQCGDDIPF